MGALLVSGLVARGGLGRRLGGRLGSAEVDSRDGRHPRTPCDSHAALIIGAVGSYLLFDFSLSLTFCGGVMLVIVAIFLYGAKQQTPQELCEALCGCGRGDVDAEADRSRLVSDCSDEAPTKPSTPAPAGTV